MGATQPQNLTAVGDNQQVSLQWSASAGSPIITYQLYRSSDGFNNEFVVNTEYTSFIDENLSKNTSYNYYVVAWNELGTSESSETSTATTTSQSNVLASEIPENLNVQLDQNARASNYIDGYAQLNWNSKEYLELLD